jgi:hypothetical protein
MGGVPFDSGPCLQVDLARVGLLELAPAVRQALELALAEADDNTQRAE